MLDNATTRFAPSLPAVTRSGALGLLVSALLLGAAVLGPAGAQAAAPAAGPAPAEQPAVGATGPTGAEDGPVSGEESDAGLRRKPVSLRLSRSRAGFGRTVKLRGANGLGAPGRVRIQLRAAGRQAWRTLTRVRARADGRFRGAVTARTSGRLRALDPTGAASKPVSLRVRSRARLHRLERTVKLGEKLRITGTVRPRGVRTVKIRLAGAGRTVKVRTRAGGRFAYAWRPARAGDVRIRARVLPDRLAAGDGSGRRRVSALRPGGASFYGPGLYGNGVACGGTLRPGTRGVAHKTLPCGTKVTIQYGGRVVTARVIDRGPYVAGRDWDLTAAVRNQLGFGGVGTVWTNR